MVENEPLIKERPSLILSPLNGRCIFKTGHFLNPSIPPSNQAQIFINPPPKYHPTTSISPIFHSLTSKIRFNGWNKPLKDWSSWVENLQPSFESTWKKASIFEAIMCSTLQIPRCKPSIFGLAEKWCPETSTFMLPWGEVTLTLEDVMVLGGFSVTGAFFLTDEIHSEEFLEIEESLLAVRSELIKTKSRKPSQKQWMDKWMGTRQAFEHEAFLSFWLSRYVLPADDLGTINKRVFKIAILLSRGIKIALAPVVLSSIYRDLRLLKEKIAAIRALSEKDHGNVSNIMICAPLNLLQMWFWERFSKFSPKSNPMTSGLCWAERWHKVEISEYYELNLVTNHDSGDFIWRPYSITLDMQSYGRCIRVSKLVGLNCIEQYFPHRVARQFGFDQDIPITIVFPSGNTEENAWNNYNKPIMDSKLYVTLKSYKASVTLCYFSQWRNYVASNDNDSCGIKKENISKNSIVEAENELDVPPGFSPIRKRVVAKEDSSSDQHQPSSKRSMQYPGSLDIYAEIMSSHSNVSLDSSQTKDLLKANGFHGENRSGGILSMIHRDNPSPSIGDNAFIEERKSTKYYPGHMLPSKECTMEGVTFVDGIKTDVGSSIKSPIIVDKDVRTSIDGARDSDEDMYLLDRIARLQKIVDLVRAAKTGEN